MSQPEDEDQLHDDDMKDIKDCLGQLEKPAAPLPSAAGAANVNPFTSSQNYIGQIDSTSRQIQSKDGQEVKPAGQQLYEQVEIGDGFFDGLDEDVGDIAEINKVSSDRLSNLYSLNCIFYRTLKLLQTAKVA